MFIQLNIQFFQTIVNSIVPYNCSTQLYRQICPLNFLSNFANYFLPHSPQQHFSTTSFTKIILFSLTHNFFTHFVNLLFPLFCHTLWPLAVLLFVTQLTHVSRHLRDESRKQKNAHKKVQNGTSIPSGFLTPYFHNSFP